eukprot:scaffold200098_cov39-Prasinocladus_malaysianus.AAC.1
MLSCVTWAFLLAALESVHTGHLNLLIELLPQTPIAQHDVEYVDSLAVIGRDDANLARIHPCTQKPEETLVRIGWHITLTT